MKLYWDKKLLKRLLTELICLFFVSKYPQQSMKLSSDESLFRYGRLSKFICFELLLRWNSFIEKLLLSSK